MRIRPSLWYNGYDGVKAGLALSGDYMRRKHIFELFGWFSSGLGQAHIDTVFRKNHYQQFSFLADYKTSLHSWVKGLSIYAHARSLDGVDMGILGLDNVSTDKRTRLYTHTKQCFAMNAGTSFISSHPVNGATRNSTARFTPG